VPPANHTQPATGWLTEITCRAYRQRPLFELSHSLDLSLATCFLSHSLSSLHPTFIVVFSLEWSISRATKRAQTLGCFVDLSGLISNIVMQGLSSSKSSSSKRAHNFQFMVLWKLWKNSTKDHERLLNVSGRIYEMADGLADIQTALAQMKDEQTNEQIIQKPACIFLLIFHLTKVSRGKFN